VEEREEKLWPLVLCVCTCMYMVYVCMYMYVCREEVCTHEYILYISGIVVRAPGASIRHAPSLQTLEMSNLRGGKLPAIYPNSTQRIVQPH
jgi:hypothetical protein